MNVVSGQQSKIACQCKADFGGFSLFVGCKWKLVESNCPSLLFSLASDSADFDGSFDDITFIEDISEVYTTSSDTSFLASKLESLKQELEKIKQQFENDTSIEVIKGMNQLRKSTA